MNDEIAVVGFACRFPGAADADSYFSLLRDGRSGLRTVETAPGRVGVVGTLDSALAFDPAPFGLGDAEARMLDPQHRIFLECVADGLDHAGHGRPGARGAVGVYAGTGLSSYLTSRFGDRFDPTGGDDPVSNLALHSANVAEYMPLRAAHALDLDGPAVSIGATCATSLVAVHQAVQSLLAGECDTAVAGGVTVTIPESHGYVSVPDGPFSSDGVTRAYSQRGDGTVFTDGAGVAVLRRLDDAVAAGDTIHAVVLGSAVSNDGADRIGFTAPSESGQAATIAQALAMADCSPSDLGMIEGHGTATALGDRIEIAALKRIFGDQRTGEGIALGSVKTNIGHTGSAAGIAGFLKAVLCVRDGILVPSLHADPVDDLDSSPFNLPTRARSSERLCAQSRSELVRHRRHQCPRRAGILTRPRTGFDPPDSEEQLSRTRTHSSAARRRSTQRGCRRDAARLLSVGARSARGAERIACRTGRCPRGHRPHRAERSG